MDRYGARAPARLRATTASFRVSGLRSCSAASSACRHSSGDEVCETAPAASAQQRRNDRTTESSIGAFAGHGIHRCLTRSSCGRNKRCLRYPFDKSWSVLAGENTLKSLSWIIAVVLLASVTAGSAQTQTGAITGSVTDESGAVLRGAQIS